MDKQFYMNLIILFLIRLIEIAETEYWKFFLRYLNFTELRHTYINSYISKVEFSEKNKSKRILKGKYDRPGSAALVNYVNSVNREEASNGSASPFKLHIVVVYHITNLAIWTRVFEDILAYGKRLRSTHCREFHYLKLCGPAYFVRTTQLLPHPGHE